jgi:hypothetical protein
VQNWFQSLSGLGLLLVCQSVVRAELDVHEDYYAGFAQGAYYGLLLAGEDYEVAWCMRGELEFEAKGMGQGVAFQKTMERLLAECRETHGHSRQQ